MISVGFVSLVLLAPATAERSVHSIFIKLASFADSDYGHVFSAAWQAWLEYPWFGSGIHTYQQVCEQMGVLNSHGMACTHPHNLYLQLAVETGLIGLGLFVLLLVAIYSAVLKPACSAKQYFTASLSIAVLTVSFWPLTGGISVLNNWIAALVWLGVGWVLAVSTEYKKVPYPQKAGVDH